MTSYFVSDHLGSTNALTDSSGAITSQARYDAFGSQTGNLATRYGFTGREYDSLSGVNFYRARFYDSKIGRFISEDPIGFAGGDINLYGYVGNQPNVFRDPSGRVPVPILIYGGIVIGGAILFSATPVNAPGPNSQSITPIIP